MLAEERRDTLASALGRTREALSNLAEWFSDQAIVVATQAAFECHDRAPRRDGTDWRLGTDWRPADASLGSAIDLSATDWIGAYLNARRWHRLAVREVAPGFLYVDAPTTVAYWQLLNVADRLGLDPAAPLIATERQEA